MSQPKRNRSGEYARRKTKCLQFNLCFQCQETKGSNHFKCDNCLNKNNNRDRERRQERAEIGLCDCGRPSLPDGRLCEKCVETTRLFQEQKRDEHRREGTCLTCGKPPVKNQATCEECQKRATTSTLKRYFNNITNKKCALCGGQLNLNTFRCDTCSTEHCERGRIYWHRDHMIVLEHYGQKCVCCNETIKELLEIDHLNNDGANHRQNVHGHHVYEWIIKQNFPTTIQIMCANCNRGRAKFGICPHIQQPTNKSCHKQRRKRASRQRVIERYGGACKCCGESNWAFLEFDHINNDGAEHRRQVGAKHIVRWIIENNYPDTIQLLCSNCNKAKGLYGCCPHSVSLDL